MFEAEVVSYRFGRTRTTFHSDSYNDESRLVVGRRSMQEMRVEHVVDDVASNGALYDGPYEH